MASDIPPDDKSKAKPKKPNLTVLDGGRKPRERKFQGRPGKGRGNNDQRPLTAKDWEDACALALEGKSRLRIATLIKRDIRTVRKLFSKGLRTGDITLPPIADEVKRNSELRLARVHNDIAREAHLDQMREARSKAREQADKEERVAVQGSRAVAIRAIANLNKCGELVSAVTEHVLADTCERVAGDDGRTVYRVRAGKHVSVTELAKLLSVYNTGVHKLAGAAKMIRHAGVAERALDAPDEVPATSDAVQETQAALVSFAKQVVNAQVVWGDPAFAGDEQEQKPR